MNDEQELMQDTSENSGEDTELFISPKIDYAFKEIMRNEKVRKSFLSAVLEIPIGDIGKTEILNTVLPKTGKKEKQGILDVYLELKDHKTKANIEIQLYYMSAWANRSVFYVSKMVSEQKNINLTYTNIKKCIAINILDFVYIKNTDRFHTTYHLSDDKEHFIYSDLIEIHLVELPKLPKMNDGTDLYTWTKFLKAKNKEELQMLAQNNEALTEAVRELDFIGQDSVKRMNYTSRMKEIYDQQTLIFENWNSGKAAGIAEGIEIGEKKGRAEGELSQSLAIARELISLGNYSREQIAQITKLSIEQVNNL